MVSNAAELAVAVAVDRSHLSVESVAAESADILAEVMSEVGLVVVVSLAVPKVESLIVVVLFADSLVAVVLAAAAHWRACLEFHYLNIVDQNNLVVVDLDIDSFADSGFAWQ